MTVTYFDYKTDKDSGESENHSFKEIFTLDLSTFKDLQFVEQKGLHEIAKSTEKLADEVSGLRLHLKKIQILK